jgi:hypothetical protein
MSVFHLKWWSSLPGRKADMSPPCLPFTYIHTKPTNPPEFLQFREFAFEFPKSALCFPNWVIYFHFREFVFEFPKFAHVFPIRSNLRRFASFKIPRSFSTFAERPKPRQNSGGLPFFNFGNLFLNSRNLPLFSQFAPTSAGLPHSKSPGVSPPLRTIQHSGKTPGDCPSSISGICF